MTKPRLYARFALVMALSAAPAFAQGKPRTQDPRPAPPCAACVTLVITPGQTLALPLELAGLTLLVRVVPAEERNVEAALDAIAQRNGRPGLLVDGVPVAPLADSILARAQVVLIDLSAFEAADIEALAFRLKTHLTRVRAVAPRARLGVSGVPALLGALLARDLAPYVDVLGWRGEPDPRAPASETWRLPPKDDVVTNLATALAATQAAGTPGQTIEPSAWLWRAPHAVDEFASLVTDLARAAPLLPRDLAPGSSVRVTCGGAAAETYLNPRTLETIAIARGCGPGAPVDVEPAEPGIERVDLSTGDTLVRVPAPASPDRFAEGVQVVGARQLTVEEIIARHQAFAARQAALVRTRISRGMLAISFEAPGFPAPVTITSHTTIYAGPGILEMEQRRILVNGIAFRGGGVPRLPILEPERAASPPLAITLGAVYRYRLAGRETIGRTPAYVVEFEPVDSRASLYRGRAWIAVDTFAMLRVAAAQTGLRGAIVSSEQIDEYRREASGLWLLARSDVRQVYEGAAHRTPIHRVLSIEAHEVNPPDFDARRAAAHASDAIMLRDTSEGYRYLKREPSRAGTSAVERAVAAASTRVRTLAAGVIVDPNISRPLPFAGLSYVDFDLGGTGAQLNAFFGGSYGQLAFSVPSLGGTRWQLAARAFGIASSYNDRWFVNGRERYEQNIRQRPAHGSVWLLRPLTPRISARAGYELDYTHFTAADSTAPAFAVPAHQVVHGLRLALEGQRAGWNGSIWWNSARRTGWAPWGLAGEYDATHRDFQRYGLSLVRSAVLSASVSWRVEAAAMAGQDLDRFSRYSFGTFDNRLRGYPSALIRYDRGVVGRGALAWSPAPFVRVDAFLDSAAVRDPGFGRGLRNYTGVGAALEAPAPFGTLVAVEWGYGFRGMNANGGLGTQVIRISGYKIF